MKIQLILSCLKLLSIRMQCLQWAILKVFRSIRSRFRNWNVCRNKKEIVFGQTSKQKYSITKIPKTRRPTIHRITVKEGQAVWFLPSHWWWNRNYKLWCSYRSWTIEIKIRNWPRCLPVSMVESAQNITFICDQTRSKFLISSCNYFTMWTIVLCC